MLLEFTGISSEFVFKPGNCLCNGNQQLRATTPANGLLNVRAEYKAKAPPCENPPKTIRSAGTPFSISVLIILCIFTEAALMPSSSSGPEISKVFKSNHDGIRKPAFKETGCVGAVGQTTFMQLGRMAAKALLQPCL